MSEYPLISVIMPTRNRRRFIPQAIRSYLRQDYPNTELIIIDDGEESAIDHISFQENIRYVEISHPLSIGMKRNIACSLARGEIIAHADDDDYFGPTRLSKQAAPILANEADVTGMHMSLLLRTQDMTLWSPSIWVHSQLFPYDVRAGTLLYRAVYWRAGLCYDNSSRGEDASYLQELLIRGARGVAITDPASYICVRHGENATEELAGMDPPEWEQVPLGQYMSEEQRAFYARIGAVRV